MQFVISNERIVTFYSRLASGRSTQGFQLIIIILIILLAFQYFQFSYLSAAFVS